MSDSMDQPIRIPIGEVDQWIFSAIEEYGPKGITFDDTASIDLKMTKLRGRTDKYALTMLFHIDYQDEVFYVVMDWNKRTHKNKCSLSDWMSELDQFSPPVTEPK